MRRTLTFNCFVFMQIFNQLNCRRLDRHYNVLEGFFRNYWFIGIFLISESQQAGGIAVDSAVVGGQCIIVELGGVAFLYDSDLRSRLGDLHHHRSLFSPYWSACPPLPHRTPRACPDPLASLPRPHKTPDRVPRDRDIPIQLRTQQGQRQLSTYANIRGGRLRASSMVGKSRHQRLRDADIQLPSLLAMIPTVIAGGIAQVATGSRRAAVRARWTGESGPRS